MLFPEPHAEQPATQPALVQFPLGVQSNPGKAAYVSERRSEPRADLTVAALVVPMEGGAPDISRAFTAITKDMSSKGIGVIANRFILAPEVLICLWSEGDLRLLRAVVRHRRELSRGWVRFGVEVTGPAEKNEYPQLCRFVTSLIS